MRAARRADGPVEVDVDGVGGTPGRPESPGGMRLLYGVYQIGEV